MVQVSRKLYLMALKRLQESLWNPVLMHKDDTLGASMALAMYEAMESPSQTEKGYLSHVNGLARLIELRGPEAHRTGLGHHIFIAFRYTEVNTRRSFRSPGTGDLSCQILQAVGRNQASFLATPQWRSLPFEMQPKNSLGRLLDILTCGPQSMEEPRDLDVLSPSHRLQTLLKMARQCWKLERDLQRFYQDLERSAVGALYWPLPSRLFESDSSIDDDRAIALHFADLSMAQLFMFYWAILGMVWKGLTQLHEAISQIQLPILFAPSAGGNPGEGDTPAAERPWSRYDMSQLPQLGHRKDYGSMARKVCQSFEYCTQDEMRGVGPTVPPASLGLSYRNVKDEPRYYAETQWLESSLDALSRKHVGFAKHIKSVKTGPEWSEIL
ncbi:MAG: hypothetical protein M1828_001986 [Chrysothrix sp. TS-e1954]|nr:MAG: hypothetical protein M1828_001986 [Chrysothrix sp. TS-e1954]